MCNSDRNHLYISVNVRAAFPQYISEGEKEGKAYGNDNFHDDIVILLGTRLRVSELYGLAKADADLKNRPDTAPLS